MRFLREREHENGNIGIKSILAKPWELRPQNSTRLAPTLWHQEAGLQACGQVPVFRPHSVSSDPEPLVSKGLVWWCSGVGVGDSKVSANELLFTKSQLDHAGRGPGRHLAYPYSVKRTPPPTGLTAWAEGSPPLSQAPAVSHLNSVTPGSRKHIWESHICKRPFLWHRYCWMPL